MQLSVARKCWAVRPAPPTTQNERRIKQMLRKIAWLMLACIAIAIVGGCKGAETTNGGGEENGMQKPETPNGGDTGTTPPAETGTGDTGTSTTPPAGEEGGKTPTEGATPPAPPTEGGN
jgi:hypothetical protein